MLTHAGTIVNSTAGLPFMLASASTDDYGEAYQNIAAINMQYGGWCTAGA